jgi:hypothetical protein
MPGLYAHMDVARAALSNLGASAGSAAIFASNGPGAPALESIALNNPAYSALGAIGPDMFFLLPDFKGDTGTYLWGAANFIRDTYTWLDDNFLGPWEDALGPIGMNSADELGALTGGLSSQLGNIASETISFLKDAIITLMSRQYDVFGVLSSGVQDGYDEKSFFWSDMFHYRKTSEFGHYLFAKARDSGNEAHMAFALGWISHIATDVTGHAFTNEKCGGPYRLHWQRHKLVENHMDAKILDNEHGTDEIYNQLSNSALHLWITFNGDGTSRHDFFDAQPGPTYSTGDQTPDILDRHSKWDVDSDLPDEVAMFLSEAIVEFFTDDRLDVAAPTGAVSSHPVIIEDIQPGTQGYPDAEALRAMYWWLTKYLKFTTTDFYKMRYPDFDAIIIEPFPSPPGSGSSMPGPGGEDDNPWADALSLLLSIFAWIAYIGQVVAWALTVLPGIIASLATMPLRYLIYEYLEVPLYNAWMALHFYLAHTGFANPMKSEMNPGLMTLGVAPQNSWAQVEAALSDLSGGIGSPLGAGDEPSGDDQREGLPKEVVVDTPANVSLLSQLLDLAGVQGCPPGIIPSEFLRPWLYPSRNMDGSAILTEPLDTASDLHASPYPGGTDATVLMASSPGDAAARVQFESAMSELETLQAQVDHLKSQRTLGGPIDFTTYLVARLTRDNPGTITNFNLDSDRGYAYLAWDWLRDGQLTGTPEAYVDTGAAGHNLHDYPPPVAPGYGWCEEDVAPPAPTTHDPRAPQPVKIRYIDREDKFV